MKWIFELIVKLLVQSNGRLKAIEDGVAANGAKLDQIIEAIKAPPDVTGFDMTVDPPTPQEK